MFARRCIWLISKTFNILVACLLFLLFLIGTYSLWDSQLVIEQASASKWEMYKPDKTSDSFEKLRDLNSDVKGWLTVYGTHIDYPILYTEDPPDFYLTHDALKQYSAPGSLFVEVPNKPDFSESCTIIYGHHMEHEVMFGDIDKFNDEKFFKEHKYGEIDFIDEQGKLQHRGLLIAGMLNTDAYDRSVYRQVNPSQLADYQQHLISSCRYTNPAPYSGQKIVLLSTCSSSGTNARDVLVCYMTDKPHENPYPQMVNKGLGIDKLKGLFGFPWLGWIGLLMLLCLLILALIYLYDYLRGNRKREDKQV